MSDQGFQRAIRVADFPAAGMAAVTLGGWRIAIARVGEAYRAVNDRCPHAASPLSPGRLRQGVVMCPRHGARFDLATGQCIGGAYRAVRTFAVQVSDGWIEVLVPADPPRMGEAPLEG